MNQYRIEDFTKRSDYSDVIAVVYYEKFRGYVRILKDGSVTLVSPAGVVSAKFRELEKRDWLRENYVSQLVAKGIRGKELENALKGIERVEKRLSEEIDSHKGMQELEERSLAHLKEWSLKRGMDDEKLTEEHLGSVVQEGVKQIRNSQG